MTPDNVEGHLPKTIAGNGYIFAPGERRLPLCNQRRVFVAEKDFHDDAAHSMRIPERHIKVHDKGRACQGDGRGNESPRGTGEARGGTGPRG